MFRLPLILAALAWLLASSSQAARTSEHYSIDAEAISSGGVGSASTHYEMDATFDVPYAGFAETSEAVYAAETGYLTGDSAEVGSIRRIDASPTDAASVRWNVTFRSPVSGLTASSFAAVESKGLTGSSVSTVTNLNGGREWQVTASAGAGVGELRLALVDARGVAPCIEGLPILGEAYAIDGSGVDVVTLDAEPVLVLQSGLFVQRIRVTNSNAFAISGFRILIAGLPEDVVAVDASGTLPDGMVFVDHAAELGDGASTVLTLEFFRPSRDPRIAPIYALQVRNSDEAQSSAPAGRRFAIDRLVRLDDGSALIEWPTLLGSFYVVEYSDDMEMWEKAGGQRIPAVGNRKQWIDSGPPKTRSHPSEVKIRCYRVVEVAED